MHRRFSLEFCLFTTGLVSLFWLVMNYRRILIEFRLGRIRREFPELAELDLPQAVEPGDSPKAIWIAIVIELVALAILSWVF